ncbi:MAG: hypothetical protein LBC75_08545 [Fibromonadaceae bacterium]|jgi:hypothetical protein|nr:hypothetical protein [Fibromonadaceae bacterium]
MFRLLMLFAIFSILACAGGKLSRYNADPDKTTEVMITFVQRAQAGFWKEAMENVSLQERSEMMDGVNVMQEYKDAVNRIRLSTIKNMDLSLDSRGRLVGLKDILDESNERNVSSDEKVVIDPSKLEDRAALRQKQEEEAAKKAELEPVKEEKSTWLDVYYGNTKSGGGGRVVKNKKAEEEEEED